MKKLAALLLCLVLLCPFALAEAVDFTGAWYLHSVSAEGMTFGVADLGMSMTMTMNADGTVSMVSDMSGEEAGTWTQNGDTVVIDDGVMPMSFSIDAEGNLVSEDMGGQVMIFSREEPTPGFVPAAAVVAEDVAQFDGTWIAVYAGMEGMVVPADLIAAELGIDYLVIEIENGSITKFDAEVSEVCELTDGVLVAPSPYSAEEDPNGDYSTTVILLEDGKIEMIFGGFSFYCELQVEEVVEEVVEEAEADPAA